MYLLNLQTTFRIGGHILNPVTTIKDTACDPTDQTAANALRSMIDLCKSRNIEVLLITLPFKASEDWKSRTFRSQEIAEEYNIPYFDMTDLPLNYKTDYLDDDHLNLSRTNKASVMLGNYLLENYPELFKEKNSEVCSLWDYDYNSYCDFMLLKLQEHSSLGEYLMQLNSGISYTVTAEIYDPTILSYYLPLWENLGLNPSSLQSEDPSLIISCQYIDSFIQDKDLHMEVCSDDGSVIDEFDYSMDNGFYRENSF